MPNERKYFASKGDSQGSLDADSDVFAISPNSWVNSENVRSGSTDLGVTEVTESIGGNIQVSSPAPSVTHFRHGVAEDLQDSRIIYFLKDKYGSQDKIMCYVPSTGQTLTVLLSSQIVGGLNFEKNHIIHSARVMNGQLTWVDDYNENRSIILNAAINLNQPNTYPNVDPYAAPIKFESTTMIKRPPIYPLVIAKAVDPNFANNFIKNNAYLFAYCYTFKNNQISALSSFSHMASPNSPSDTFNSINVNVPLTEYIDDDIAKIDVYVKYGNSGAMQLTKSWSKAANSTDIANHNNGSAALKFTFYGNTAGAFLDSVRSVTPFHNLPIQSQTYETARNRDMLGNNLSGYNTPTLSSLQASLSTFNAGGGTYAGTWKYMTLQYHFASDPNPANFSFINIYYAYAPTCSPSVAFYYTLYQAVYPASVNYTDADASWNSEIGLASYIQRNNIGAGLPSGAVYTTGAQAGAYYQPPVFNANGVHNTNIVVAPTATAQRFVKSNSTYKITITFYDRHRRHCGVVKRDANISGLVVDPLSINVPIRTNNQTVFNSVINWTLSNTNAALEIPDWAWYYQIGITRNLTTRKFVQFYSPTAKYVTRQFTAGVPSYTYTNANWQVNINYAVSFDISQLVNLGMGYLYTAGDVLICYRADGTNFVQPILGQDGSNVLVAPFNLGDLTSAVPTLVEIYTPYLPVDNEPYYETGAVYPIINAGTPQKIYSTLQDTINGDCFAIQRNWANIASPQYYYAEAMSPNDLVWSDWETDTGWINLVDTIGQQRKKSEIIFSDTFVLGSKVNNVNVFQPANSKSLDAGMGALRKIILTSKTEQQGNVMLAICENETASIYLGEVQLSAQDGNAYVAASPSVIGTINVLKGSYGTLNPESVTQYRGEVFWIDVNYGRIVRYDVNGLLAISKYNMTRFWKQWCYQYKSMTSTQIEAFGGRPFVFMAVDPSHDELLISIPQLMAAPPKGYLPDYPSRVFPFDILDFQAKTIVYEVVAESPAHWRGAFTFYAEGFSVLQNKLYSFSNGNLWLHNQPNYCNFYGTQYPARIMFTSNAVPQIPKVYNNLSFESNIVPSFVYLYNSYPYQQSSDLLDFDFLNREGIWYSLIYRNKLQPTATGFTANGLMTGEEMRNTGMLLMAEWNLSNTPLDLKFVTIGFVPSLGHKNQLK